MTDPHNLNYRSARHDEIKPHLFAVVASEVARLMMAVGVVCIGIGVIVKSVLDLTRPALNQAPYGEDGFSGSFAILLIGLFCVFIAFRWISKAVAILRECRFSLVAKNSNRSASDGQ